MAARWRLIDDLQHPRDAAGQMAADMAMLDDVADRGRPALRLYQWSSPALSLGRFQDAADVDEAACGRRGVEVIRRPTGGRALLHGSDLTYSVALSRPEGPAGGVDALYVQLASGLVAGLSRLGVTAVVAHHRGETGPACFSSLRGSDLRVGGRKLVGSAQVHRDGAVLQHGSMLLRRLDFDETDLLVMPEGDREVQRRHLRESTVTLAELGVDTAVAAVAAALTWGFATALDLDFTSRARELDPRTGLVAGPGGRQ